MRGRLNWCVATGVLAVSLAMSTAASAQATGGTLHYYDNAGREVGLVEPDPDGTGTLYTFTAVRTVYDFSGRIVRIEHGTLANAQPYDDAPSAWTGFTIFRTEHRAYDTLGQLVRSWTVGQDGNTATVTETNYDREGRPGCIAVRMNKDLFPSLTSTTPAACAHRTANAEGPDRITRNIYDLDGRLRQIRRGVGTGLEVAEVTYDYNANGTQKQVIDANGNRAELRYDGHDRLKRWVFPSSTRAPNWTAPNSATYQLALTYAGALNESDYEEYGYDLNGNRTSFRKRDGLTLGYDFDRLNRNTKKTVPGTDTNRRDVYYGYDLRGLMTSAMFGTIGDAAQSTEGVSFTYDGFGRKLTETITMDGTPRKLEARYNLNGGRTRLIYPDLKEIWYSYDGQDRAFGTWIKDSPAAAVAQPLLSARFDPAGRQDRLYRLSTATGTWGPATGYSYTPASQLFSYWFSLNSATHNLTSTFTYNPANQITGLTRTNDNYAFPGYSNTTRAYVADGLNQYDSVAGVTFAHDLNGNLTSDGSNTYTYDVENRLIGRATSDGYSATVRYDPLGRLYETTGTWSWSIPTRYLYDGDALVGEYNSTNGAVRRRYVHGNGAGDDPYVWFEGPGITDAERRYLYADERGSIVAVTDSAGNVTPSQPKYDAFGVVAAGGARFQYTGQIVIGELGLYYYKARFYSATHGRFLQTDPVGYEDQFNLYSYVGNDPINGTDPTGKDCNELRTCPPGGAYPMSDSINCGLARTCTMAQQARVRERVETVPVSDPRVLAEGQMYVERGVGYLTLGAGGWVGRAAASASAARQTQSKIFNYLLNPATKDGASKAAWFERALGFTRANGDDLARQIRFDPRSARLTRRTEWGNRYEQTTRVIGANGRQGSFTTVWQVDSRGSAAGFPRLITATNFGR